MEGIAIPFLHALVVSASAGALIGLLRQWMDTHDEKVIEPVAGLRTYSLWSLFGFLSAFIHNSYADFFFPVAFASFAIFLVAAHSLDHPDERHIGLTSYVAAILTFLIGALIFWQRFQVAVAVTVTIAILLASKPFVHRWTRNLTNEDIQNLLQFLAVTGLILPLVPNQGFGPLEAFNPYNIWLMVVLISGLGFVGYIAVRILGAKAGIILTGVAGGLASSTATTLALTRNSRDNPQIAHTLAIGIIIANTVMIGRVAVIILALNQSLFNSVAVPLMVMALPTTVILFWNILIRGKKHEDIALPELHNPLSLKLAIKFALLYAVIVFLIKAVGQWGSGGGFYPVAFLSGLTDMDAIALSLTNAEKDGSILVEIAARGILLGAIANSFFKTVLALWFGHLHLRKPLLVGMIPMIVFGVLGLFLV